MSLWTRAAPLLLTVVGAIAFGSLWIHRVLSFEGTRDRVLALAAAALYGGWLAWEARVSAREVSRDAAVADRGTTELAAFAKFALLAATLGARSEPSLELGALGLTTMAMGIALRVGAVRALGSAYSHRIRALSAPVVVRGPYRYVRHPAYVGTFVAHAGLVSVLPSIPAAAALFLLWLPAVILRARVEDRFLLGFPDYAEYAKKVPHRLVPKVY